MKKDGEFYEDDFVYEQVKLKVYFDFFVFEFIYKGNFDKLMVVFLINVVWGNEYVE